MIAKRIKELRNLTGISQQKLATDLGLTQASVGNWENGTRYPKTETLKAIANYFDVSIDYLLGTSTDALLTLSPEVPLHIKELRTKHGITAKQLGEIIGVAESTISLYETGKRSPNYSTLMKIADYFNVTVDYVLGRVSIVSDVNSRTAPQFSTLLKELRTAQGKKQQEIADYLDISRQAYSNYEIGNREPDNSTLIALADYFNVSVDYLLGREPSPQNTSTIELTDTDQKLLAAYHAADPDIRFAVDLILKKYGK